MIGAAGTGASQHSDSDPPQVHQVRDESGRSMMDAPDETDVLIIGGGIVGCASAYYLSKDNVECLLVERGEINRGGTAASAGSLHVQMWSGEMRREDAIASDFIAVKLEAARMWQLLEAELGSSLGVRYAGGLLVAESRADVDVAMQLVDYQKKRGLDVEFLGSRELHDMAADLAPHLLGAVFCPMDGSANPLLIGPAYVRHALRRGARVRTHTEVVAIEPRTGGGFVVTTSAGRIVANRVLNAAGPWAGQLAAMVGCHLPIEGEVLQVSATDCHDPMLGQLVTNVAGGLTLKQTSRGNFLIGGAWPGKRDMSRDNSVDRASLVGNLGIAARIVPAIAEMSLIRSWTGVIAHVGNDGSRGLQVLQVLGELPNTPGYFIAAGRALIVLGPLFGRLISELITGRSPSAPIGIFDPSRFSAAGARA